MTCKLCAKNEVDAAGASMNICAACRVALGIVPMPLPKRVAPCGRCNGMRFVRVIPREHTAYGYETVYKRIAPMTATVAPSVTPRMIFAGNTVASHDITDGFGLLEMYVCAACGYIDWYCTNPTDIPIGPEYMSDVVDLAGDSAYR